MTGTSCQTGDREEEEETLSRFFVVSFLLLFPSCLPPTTLGSPSSLFSTSLNVASPSSPSSSGLCLVVTLLMNLLLCSITFSVSNIILQTNMKHQMLFVMSQTLKYQI